MNTPTSGSSVTRLTIAIPSYNRAALLLENLRSISGRLPSWVHILVVDNCSEPPVRFDDALHRTLLDRGVTHTIVRNATNIGGGANILRCFEHVETDWFVLCGDDDLLDPDKLEGLRELVRARPDTAFVKFSSRFHQYDAPVTGTGLGDLLRAPGDFGSLLFMSTYMFNRPRCTPFIRFGYLMNAAYAPHVAIALMAVAQGARYVLSPIHAIAANEDDATWSPVDVVMCAYHLSDLPLSAPDRTALIQKIYRSHNVGRELLDIVTIFNTSGLREEAKFLRRKALRTHLSFGSGLKRWQALLLLSICPLMGTRIQRLLAKSYVRATGREYKRQFVARHAGL